MDGEVDGDGAVEEVTDGEVASSGPVVLGAVGAAFWEIDLAAGRCAPRLVSSNSQD